MNSKKIIAFGAGAIGVAALTFTTVSPASAVVTLPTTLTEVVCAATALPASAAALVTQAGAANALVGTTGTDLTTKQGALTTSITQLIPAVVNHINAVSAGLPTAGTSGALTDKANAFATAVVAENNAMTANFDAQRSAYLTGLNSSYVTGVKNGLCII